MMWRLFYPLRYFRLRNNEKSRLDSVATGALGLLIAVPFVALPDVSFFHPNGFLDKLLTLTAALTGFYVAALVAAATFSHPDLDQPIQYGAIFVISRDDDGQKIRDFLTRREFVCAIFGYLAFLTFFLSLLFSILIGISGADLSAMAKWHIIGKLFSAYWLYTRGAVILIVSVMIAHMAVATALGLYYLMDRLYRKDRQVATKKPGANAA